MNHQKVYESIIQKAKTEYRQKGKGIYYECHHIKPLCVGGSNEDNNKVLLTAKEHYMCHKLLVKIYPNSRGLKTALYYFINKHTTSLKEYSSLKESLNLVPMSKKTCEKMSKTKQRLKIERHKLMLRLLESSNYDPWQGGFRRNR